MSEAIEYAEMLEIPVATVNVVQKKHPFRDLKYRAVGKVNHIMEQRVGTAATRKEEHFVANEPVLETAKKQPIQEDVPPMSEFQPEKASLEEEKSQPTHPVLIAEFALAAILCAFIFLTNVFVGDSAINTFLRGVLTLGEGAPAVKTYSDFTLTPVVSEYAGVEAQISDMGVLSFTAKCSVYPACDAKVGEIVRTEEDGVYTVTLTHSEGFQSVYTGLTNVYYKSGDGVFSNVPFAYSNGEHAVQVSFYQDGQLLNCYSIDAQNCLSWNK